MTATSPVRVLERFGTYFKAVGATAEVGDNVFQSKPGAAINVLFGENQVGEHLGAAAAFRESIDGVRLTYGHLGRYTHGDGADAALSPVYSGGVVQTTTEGVTNILSKLPDITVGSYRPASHAPDSFTRGEGITVLAHTEKAYTDMKALLRGEINGVPLALDRAAS